MSIYWLVRACKMLPVLNSLVAFFFSFSPVCFISTVSPNSVPLLKIIIKKSIALINQQYNPGFLWKVFACQQTFVFTIPFLLDFIQCMLLKLWSLAGKKNSTCMCLMLSNSIKYIQALARNLKFSIPLTRFAEHSYSRVY